MDNSSKQSLKVGIRFGSYQCFNSDHLLDSINNRNFYALLAYKWDSMKYKWNIENGEYWKRYMNCDVTHNYKAKIELAEKYRIYLSSHYLINHKYGDIKTVFKLNYSGSSKYLCNNTVGSGGNLMNFHGVTCFYPKLF